MIYLYLFLFEAIVCYFYDAKQLNQRKIFEIHQYKLRISVIKGLLVTAIVAPLWLVMGLRYNVGTDYRAYEDIFRIATRYKKNSYHMEWGYYSLNRIVGSITQNPQIIFLVVAFLIIFFFFKGIEKNNGSMYYGVLSFIGLGYYFYAMNIQRQYIAIMIMLYAVYFLEKKEFKKFLVCIVIATSFHFSAIIWIPVYFAVNYIPAKTFYIGSAVIALLANRFTPYVLGLLASAGFYTGQIIGNEGFFRMRLSISNVIMLGAFMICGMFFNKQLKEQNRNVLRFRPIWLAFLTYSLLYTFGGAGTRIAAYMCPMCFLVISDIINCFDKRTKRMIRVLVTLVLIILMYFVTNHEGNAFLPYQYRMLWG